MKNYGDLCQKISSRRGAAMLIALLVSFLAALSGTIALTMAASNAGRYTHEKDDQQAYLSVMSAANIILDRLEDVEIEYKASKYPQQPEDVTVSYTTEQNDLFLADKDFTKCLQVYSFGGFANFDFSLSATDAGMGTVSVSVYVYSGTFDFRLYSVDGDNREYRITMKVGTTFSDGIGNFVEDHTTGFFYKRMKFDMKKVTYVVEEGY